jgi:transposase
VDSLEKRILKQRIEREQLSAYVTYLQLRTIAMESCGVSNYWAHVFQRQGHIVKLISPQFVKPFVKTNKNDATFSNVAIIMARLRQK